MLGRSNPATCTRGLPDPQLADDVPAGLRVSRGGHGHDRHRGKQPAQAAQPGVFGAEIVPPLGDAVGLVDGEQGQFQRSQSLQKFRKHQAFRGDIEQIQLTPVHLLKDPAGFSRTSAMS